MAWIWNLHWVYFLIYEVGQPFYEIDHVTFSKNVFWSVNFGLSFYQVYSTQMSTLSLVYMLTFLLRSWTHSKFQEKSREQIHDIVLWPHFSRRIPNVSFEQKLKIFADSMYKRVITSCTCVDVSDFKHSVVKIFLLNIWSEYQKLVYKFQVFLKM